jgi:hypothetical protein
MVDWRQRNKTFFNALQVERNVMFLILTLIVLVAALNIISGLIMLVKDKGRDIAILRTMGATQRRGDARVPDHRRVHRRRRHAGGFLLGVLICLNIESIRQFLNVDDQHQHVSPNCIFCPSCRRRRCRRNHSRSWHGADAVVPGDALSVVAGRPARSGRSAAVRVSTPMSSGKMAFRSLSARGRAPLQTGRSALEIRDARDLAMWPGSRWRWSRPSGAGKSTLLHVAGLLEQADGGEVYVGGTRRRACPTTRARAAPHRHRLRLSVPSSAAGILGAGKRDAAADDPRPVEARGGKRAQEMLDLISGLASASRIGRPNCRAASSSASPSRARSPTRRAHPAGRRADRQSRSAHGRPCVRRADQLVRATGLAAGRDA